MAIRLSPNVRRVLSKIKLNRFLVITIILVVCFVLYLLLPSSSTREDEKTASNALLDKLKPNGGRKPADPALSLDEDSFYIRGKKTRILSGSIHYFRVVPDYWTDRLKKLKAMGLNTVDT